MLDLHSVFAKYFTDSGNCEGAEQKIKEKEHSPLSNHSDHQEKENLLDHEFYNFAMTL